MVKRKMMLASCAALIAIGLFVTSAYAVLSNQDWIYFKDVSTDPVAFVYGEKKEQGANPPIFSNHLRLDPNDNGYKTYANEAFLYIQRNIGMLATHVASKPRAIVAVEIPNYVEASTSSDTNNSEPAEAYMKSTANAEVRVTSGGDVIITIGGT